jgi:hypothetical protein
MATLKGTPVIVKGAEIRLRETLDASRTEAPALSWYILILLDTWVMSILPSSLKEKLKARIEFPKKTTSGTKTRG